MASSQNAPDLGFVMVGLARVAATQVRAQPMRHRLERNPKMGPVLGVGQRSPSSRASFPTSKANWAIRTLASACEGAGLT
ncbi:MAG: hypothetical protein QOF10_342 [Kribbellaceae bacterium]|jgi:hypothetical protein|nr:hypothetical protein [Kribbellaceae bacterium]